jgi:xanthine dehydrogenase YagR molybdenum-binding subunit
MATTLQEPSKSVLGRETVRVDGPLKVTGTAKYTSDFNFPGMLYAVPVPSSISNGVIRSIDASIAEKMPGVSAIFHRQNIGKIYRTAPPQGFEGIVDEKRPPLEDDKVTYYGQYVALAVADTFEHAKAAAAAVKVEYDAKQPNVATELETLEKPKLQSSRGDSDAAFNKAPVQIDQTYVTPVEHHNAIELHAVVVQWDGTNFTIYESTQAVVNSQTVMHQMLGVPSENVRIISKFLGSGFGGKLWPWTHVALGAQAARKLNKPVKLVLDRKMVFQAAGHRPLTQQRMRLGASPEGKLISLAHDYITHTSMLDEYEENCGEATPFIYSVPNLKVTAALSKRNVGTPTSMRGPGAVPGLFALESAMDELAIKLNIDPVELRLKNEPVKDEGLDIPFSSRHMVECLKSGAEKFGWSKRTPEVGSMKRDGLTLGWGVAACSWIAERVPASAAVELHENGTVRVVSGTQDIGTGTYTVMAQFVSHQLGIPLGKVEAVLGDTSLPKGPFSGGSMATASLIPAVLEAADHAIEKLLDVATKVSGSKFAKMKPDDLAFSDGRVHAKSEPAESGVPFDQVLRQGNLKVASGKGSSNGTFGGGSPKFSSHSYGAQFVEVTWQPEIARLRVNRVVTVIDAGRIINPLAGRNQIEGAVVMGVGMALFEQTHYDPRTGAPLNSNLADYIMTTHADAPRIDVTFLDYPDFNLNPLGARGIGEIGLAGVAPAITNAVYHATGVRVRKLPVMIENLLATA